MEILIAIILYLLVITFFSAFGKFLKECDDSMLHGILKNETKNRNQFHHTFRDLLQ
jgi:hypothetical protein